MEAQSKLKKKDDEFTSEKQKNEVISYFKKFSSKNF